jgi:hypothetical protein
MSQAEMRCQECGRDLDAGPLVLTEHSTAAIPEVRVGAVVVDATDDGRLLVICRVCASDVSIRAKFLD